MSHGRYLKISGFFCCRRTTVKDAGFGKQKMDAKMLEEYGLTVVLKSFAVQLDKTIEKIYKKRREGTGTVL